MYEPDGSPNSYRDFTEGIRKCRALRELNESLQRLTGLQLLILLRLSDRLVEVHPAGCDVDLPPFCKEFRSTPQGRDKCLTCRSLIAFGACYRGRIEFACHGGLTVIAAPAVRHDGSYSKRAVIVACAFTHESRERGWCSVRTLAARLGIDLRNLKRGYDSFPSSSEEARNVVHEICGVGAALVGDLEERFLGDLIDDAQSGQVQDVDSVWPAIGLTRDRSYRPEGGSVGSLLVEHVIAMVKRDPSMPFHVSSVARAAHVSANYFSALFRRHTGQTFGEFLTEQRILRACELLPDVRLTVGEVSRCAGFHDPAYFSRRFKEVMGKSPTEWRIDPTEACAVRTADH